MKFGTVKYYGHIYKFYLNLFFNITLLKMVIVRNVDVMLEQTLYHSV
jgi:hypothetical protein